MKWKEKLLNWLFPLCSVTKDLKELNEKLGWLVRAFGICPDCEKSLEDCSCNVKYKRVVYENEETRIIEVTPSGTGRSSIT